MERTIKEWLGSIPDEEIRVRALANYDPEFAEPGYKTNSLHRAIGGAFDWGISPEGYNFWEIFSDNTLYNLASITFLSLQHLLPEGDHLASHVNDSITEPLNKEIEGLRERGKELENQILELGYKEERLYAEIELSNRYLEKYKLKFARALEYLSKWKSSYPADDLDFAVKEFLK